MSQRLTAFNWAIQRACKLRDTEAIFNVAGETLEEIGLRSVFVSLDDDHGKLTIQSIYQRHPVVLAALEG